jgi:hypothetical protein
MNAHDEDRVKQLLRATLPPVDENAEPARDLWPAVLKRMDAKAATPPWFDWALLGGLLGLAAFFPSAIPVLLYYL